MKELSIEEKAKAYDGAIEKMQSMMKSWETLSYNGKTFLQDIKYIFPELKESEDERIRKKLIEAVKGDMVVGGTKDKQLAIAWLEKQGEKGINGKNREIPFADKVEPKFREGKWVVSPNGVYWHIDKISNNRYEVTSNTGESSNWPLDTNIYHSFSIQDAKDGDVLVCESGGICIFDGTVEEGKYPFAYCGVTERGFEIYDRKLPFTHTNIQPATKEQRDALEKAMADAGYTFDFEKKELKKIEQKPAWSEEDEKYLIYNIEQDYRNNLNNNPPESLRLYYNKVISWLKSRIPQIDVTDEELAEAKKEAYNEALGKIEYHNGEPTFDDGWSAAIWYLKKRNGRPQNAWKPSDEQIIDLEKAIDDFIPSSYKEIRVSLEKLLKQLKEL